MMTRSLRGLGLVLSLALVTAACGEDGEGGGGTAGSGGGTAGSGGGTAGSGGGTGGADAGVGGGGTGGSATGGSGGSTDAGAAKLVPTITGTQLYVNCMPIVGPDPINGSFQVKYDNTAGTAAGQTNISSVTLALTKGPSSLDWTFEVTPPGSGTVGAGQTAVAQHTKTAGSGKGSDTTKGPCQFCGGSGTLTVKWANGATDNQKVTNLLCAM
jgi:hypothetical protein